MELSIPPEKTLFCIPNCLSHSIYRSVNAFICRPSKKVRCVYDCILSHDGTSSVKVAPVIVKLLLLLLESSPLSSSIQ